MKIKTHIIQAQNIFIDGNNFDQERSEFINNLETCDLLAVPGSGKTTALLAKLYCLGQNMPFENGSGILVLAHTNHAIDEIENKLKIHCPQLFEYPNFVGTVQAFVNKFLTLPYYENKNKKKISKIDDDYHDYYLKKIILETFYASTNLKHIYRTPKIPWKYNFELSKIPNQIIDLETKERIQIYKPRGRAKKYVDWDNETKLKIEKNLYKIKLDLLKKGILKFSDSYFFSNIYIEKFPQIRTILQNRFKYVFVDEMQDLEDFQIKIIDNIFFGNDSKTKIQRIGDVNQSIFNSGKRVKIECDWKPRNKIFFKNSLRLNSAVANLVNKFILETQFDESGNKLEVIGCNNSQQKLLPQLILINQKTTGEEIKAKFLKVIVENNLHKDASNKKNGFHIIGWSTEWDDNQKSIDKDGIKRYRLKDFFEDYYKESKQKKEDYDCLRKYLFLFDKEKETFEAVRKSILNSLTRVLSIEEIYKDKQDKYFHRKSSLIEVFKNQGNDFYNNFNSKLFSWCFDIITQKKYEDVYIRLKTFIESIEFIGLNWHNEETHVPSSINKSKEFIDKGFKFDLIPEQTKKEKTPKDEINVKLSSIHAVKGQTHCATMYVETSYHNYETKKTQIKKVLLGNEHDFKPGHKDLHGKQALKMMYVGFSRPTHLLCFVVLEENVIGDKLLFDKAGWKWDDDLIKVS